MNRDRHNPIPLSYPLENRWQGTVLATALAATVVQQVTGTPLEDPLTAAGKAAMHLAQCLVQAGQWERALRFGMTLAIAPDHRDPVPGAATITALPLILFCHENPDRLHSALSQMLPLYGYGPIPTACTRIWARAIIHRLNPTYAADPLMPALRQGADRLMPDSPLLQLLQQVQALEQNRASLAAAIADLAPYSPEFAVLGLALYCGLSSPTDLSLALRRAARCPHAVSVCALTGALSGAAHSHLGIPLAWQLPRDQPLSWGISPAHLGALTRQLFATWSGAQPHLAHDLSSAAIAAPRRRTADTTTPL